MRILIAINCSADTNEILQFSKQFLCCTSDPPVLLQVLDPGKDRPPCQKDSVLQKATELFETHCLQTKVRIGKLAEEILAEVQEGSFGLVILGDRPHRILGRVFGKPVSQQIIEGADCSVMIVRGRTGPVHKILLCDSGAQGSGLLERFTNQVAGLLDGQEEVTVLHVMSQISAGPGVVGKQLRANAEDLIVEHTPEGELLERDVQSLQKSGIHHSAKVRHGLVVEEILAEARSGDYDLVVIGSHHATHWQHFLLDDLARQIITNVDRPVWVVK